MSNPYKGHRVTGTSSSKRKQHRARKPLARYGALLGRARSRLASPRPTPDGYRRQSPFNNLGKQCRSDEAKGKTAGYPQLLLPNKRFRKKRNRSRTAFPFHNIPYANIGFASFVRAGGWCGDQPKLSLVSPILSPALYFESGSFVGR
jgi:hypothetical protein